MRQVTISTGGEPVLRLAQRSLLRRLLGARGAAFLILLGALSVVPVALAEDAPAPPPPTTVPDARLTATSRRHRRRSLRRRGPLRRLRPGATRRRRRRRRRPFGSSADRLRQAARRRSTRPRSVDTSFSDGRRQHHRRSRSHRSRKSLPLRNYPSPRPAQQTTTPFSGPPESPSRSSRSRVCPCSSSACGSIT